MSSKMYSLSLEALYFLFFFLKGLSFSFFSHIQLFQALTNIHLTLSYREENNVVANFLVSHNRKNEEEKKKPTKRNFAVSSNGIRLN